MIHLQMFLSRVVARRFYLMGDGVVTIINTYPGSGQDGIDLSGSKKFVVSESNAADGDVLNVLQMSGTPELTVDGVSNIEIGNIGNISHGTYATFNVTNGGSLTINQDHLEDHALKNVTFGVGDDSEMVLNLNDTHKSTDHDVAFSSNGSGSFTLNKGYASRHGEDTFNVSGMQAGDQLHLGDGTWDLDKGHWGNEEAYRDGALHLTGNGGDVNARIEMTDEQYAEFQKDSSGYISGGTFTQVCFAAGTMIATPDGEIAVETLSIGDLVMTASGGQVPVKWIGLQTIRRLTVVGDHSPVRIREGALAASVPNQDLVLTASHGVILDDLVINAGALVNHDTIDYVPGSELSDAVTYYHIETDSHEVILANGTEAETYIDYVNRQAFDNYAEYVALYGIETRVVEMPRHRISSRRLLPLALRERLGIQGMMSAAKTA